MKLKKLLKMIPEKCNIGITDSSGEVSFVSYGTKKEAVKEYAQRALATTVDIEDLEVDTIVPCARVYYTDERVFGDMMPSLYVEPQFYIEVKLKGLEEQE